MSSSNEKKIVKKQPKMTEKSRKMLENNIGIIKNALRGKNIKMKLINKFIIKKTNMILKRLPKLSVVINDTRLQSRPDHLVVAMLSVEKLWLS